ncbi:uncharacterized protein ANIA_11324 [Aspergillus nidulans FGSC A4]|uniref:Uncharacterized protein n=1 Tax=Emericella nidulans (strain FGSC A4 / ATCC 38163 / CBS 112.46 / NRRL 194 / M139) TaxID=227321 RepID=C8VLP4_EMENI|nr:hypothetical protein [Aspergillus nidulans FGSC A4]CBF86113.1 TPA: hypothetical protein ANIA_11324 [Aspergillus nidulans FGSC A4]
MYTFFGQLQCYWPAYPFETSADKCGQVRSDFSITTQILLKYYTNRRSIQASKQCHRGTIGLILRSVNLQVASYEETKMHPLVSFIGTRR